MAEPSNRPDASSGAPSPEERGGRPSSVGSKTVANDLDNNAAVAHCMADQGALELRGNPHSKESGVTAHRRVSTIGSARSLEHATKLDIVSHLKSVTSRWAHRRLDGKTHTAVVRLQLVEITDLYDEYCRRHSRTGMAVLFAHVILAGETQRLSQQVTDRTTYRKKVAGMWKRHIKKSGLWRELVKAFGVGILLLVGAELDTETEYLTKDYVTWLVRLVSEKHPTMREDLEDLSEWFTTYYETGLPPEKRLRLENMTENEIREKLPRLGDVLSYAEGM